MGTALAAAAAAVFPSVVVSFLAAAPVHASALPAAVSSVAFAVQCWKCLNLSLLNPLDFVGSHTVHFGH